MAIESTAPATLPGIDMTDAIAPPPEPGTPITVESLDGGKFLKKMNLQLSQAVAQLKANGDSGKNKVVAVIDLEAQGFCINLGTTVEIKGGKMARWESRMTATATDGQLRTLAADAEPSKKKRGPKKKDEPKTLAEEIMPEVAGDEDERQEALEAKRLKDAGLVAEVA